MYDTIAICVAVVYTVTAQTAFGVFVAMKINEVAMAAISKFKGVSIDKHVLVDVESEE